MTAPTAIAPRGFARIVSWRRTFGLSFRKYRVLLAYAVRYRRGWATILLMTLLSTGVGLLTPLPLKILVDNVLGHHEEAAAINRRDRAVRAQMQAAAARFGVADDPALAFMLQTGVFIERGQRVAHRQREGKPLEVRADRGAALDDAVRQGVRSQETRARPIRSPRFLTRVS